MTIKGFYLDFVFILIKGSGGKNAKVQDCTHDYYSAQNPYPLTLFLLEFNSFIMLVFYNKCFEEEKIYVVLCLCVLCSLSI